MASAHVGTAGTSLSLISPTLLMLDHNYLQFTKTWRASYRPHLGSASEKYFFRQAQPQELQVSAKVQLCAVRLSMHVGEA